MGPKVGLNIQRQMTPTTTMLMTWGKKSAVRKKANPGMARRLKREARNSPIRIGMMLKKITKTRLLRRAL